MLSGNDFQKPARSIDRGRLRRPLPRSQRVEAWRVRAWRTKCQEAVATMVDAVMRSCT